MTWELDTAHSQVQFSVRHMMISTVRGKFLQFAANAQIDAADLSKAQVEATAEVASIDTGDAQRDGHLKSPDFFDAEKFPQLRLVTRSIQKNGDKVQVEADLTIRDVTRSVTFQGEALGPAQDPWGASRVGVHLATEIEREEFGLGWNQVLEAGGVLVGKKVKIEIDAEFVKK